MSITDLPTDALERAGLPGHEVQEWARSTPVAGEAFEPAAESLSVFLRRGVRLADRLPPVAKRSPTERAAAAALTDALSDARVAWLQAHTAQLYDDLTEGCSRPLRIEWLVNDAAVKVPGLVPGYAEMEAERALPLAEKRGWELAQGLLVAHVLALPREGRHLVQSMLAPTAEAQERLDEFRATGTADLGYVQVTRHGRASVLELRNQRHLNAEDGLTLGPTEVAVDLILLDPATEIGVIRGAAVEHPSASTGQASTSPTCTWGGSTSSST